MSRPQRRCGAPQRFGTFAAANDVEELVGLLEEEGSDAEEQARPRRRGKASAVSGSDEEEQAHPCKRGKASAASESDGEEQARPRKRGKASAAAAAAAGGDDEQSDDEEGSGDSGSESEGEEEEARAPAARATVRRQPRFEPPPPAEPRSSSDMMSLIYACPALLDACLEPDGLRTVTLVARDMANLATALGARSAEMAGVWKQLARRCSPTLAGDATAEQVLAEVKRVVAADPARADRLNTSTAEREYRVGRKELQSLNYTTRYSDSFWATSVKMFSKLDVLAIAHRKWRLLEVLQEEKAVAAAKSARAKETRDGRRVQREKELAKALAEAGLQGPKTRAHAKQSRRAFKDFTKKGQGSLAAIVQAAKQSQEDESAKTQRRLDVMTRLREEGLSNHQYSSGAQRYINGNGGQSLDEVVAGLKQAQQEAEQREARRTRITELLNAEGLQAYVPQLNVWGGGYRASNVPGLDSFVHNGVGSEEAVLAAARSLRDAEQARQQRRQRIEELLAAEGLQQYAGTSATYRYVQYGDGTEEGAVEAARARAAQEAAAAAARAARLAEVQAALAAEDIPYASVQHSHQLDYFVSHGTGTMEAALEGARVMHQRNQRRQQVSALLEAEGLSYQLYQYRVPGLYDYVFTGTGDAGELVAQAKLISQQAAAPAPGAAAPGGFAQGGYVV